jgi:phosphotransferase system HPr (HPr) family protein
MVIEKLKLSNGCGLHARPASEFVREAAKYESKIQIRNLTMPSGWVDAKSILSILTLGVENNHSVEIKFEGPDENDASTALSSMVRQFNVAHK